MTTRMSPWWMRSRERRARVLSVLRRHRGRAGRAWTTPTVPSFSPSWVWRSRAQPRHSCRLRVARLQTFFTAGPKEARAWTVPVGARAPQAAGVIHTDFEKGFIRAEVVGYEDFIACKGEQGAKEAGKWRLEGKEYLMREGDVVHFRFNV